MNWRCGLGWHDWKYDGQQDIGGYVIPGEHITVHVGRRTIYFRKCACCGKEGQYYQTNRQLVDLIRQRTALNAKR